MPGTVLLVRHAAPVVDAASAPSTWALTPAGRERARALGERVGRLLDGRVVASSDERKAVETTDALLAGHRGHVERAPASADLREVAKPWIGDARQHDESCARYLGGEPLDGWEAPADALTRFARGVAALGDAAAAVTHGTVTTLYLASLLEGFDAPAYWSALTMPDAWLLDLDRRTLTRVP